MEALGIAMQMGFLALIFAIPIRVVLKGNGFVRVNIISLPLICILIFLAAYWSQFFSELRLETMGFDFLGMNDAERARNVLPELREDATKLYWSNTGVGWPLKAISGIALFAAYPTIVWCAGVLFRYVRRMHDRKIT